MPSAARLGDMTEHGVSAGDSVPVPDDRIVVAGNILLKLI
jgi:hypothetical protein